MTPEKDDPKICLNCTLPECNEKNKGCVYRRKKGLTPNQIWYREKKRTDPAWWKKMQAKNRKIYLKRANV